MTVSTSNKHNHVYRASIIRAPLPVREIVLNADLSQIQTRRAIQHQYQDVVSN